MSDRHLRRATAPDADAIAEVYLRARVASVPAIPPIVHADDEVRTWFAEVVLPSREVWVVEGPGQDILALLVLDDDWVDQLYVDPDATDRGIGSLLIERAKERRPDHLQLWTFQANVGARRFYERHGFDEREATSGENEERSPDVRYEWRPAT